MFPLPGASRALAGTTVDDVLQLSETCMNPMAATPANLSFADLQTVFNSADLSSGRPNWFTLNLEPGNYLLVCFIPDQETGIPHAMIDIVTVE